MRVEDLLVYGKTYCHSDHVKLLLADLLNLNPLELLNHLEDIVEDEKIDLFKKEIKSLSVQMELVFYRLLDILEF